MTNDKDRGSSIQVRSVERKKFRQREDGKFKKVKEFKMAKNLDLKSSKYGDESKSNQTEIIDINIPKTIPAL